jgi:hypothetical protein
MKENLFNLVNAIYTLLTLSLLLLMVNYFVNFIEVPESVIVIILVLSAIVFSLRMYLKYSRRRN